MTPKASPIVVVGPGAVGTMLAARLQISVPGRRIYLAGSSSPSPETAAHLDEISANGIIVHGETTCATRPLVCRGAMDEAASHLLFAVKAGRMREAATEFSKMADRKTIVAVFSNGLNVCDHLPSFYRESGVVRGLINTGAELAKAGYVNQFGSLDITLAPGLGSVRGFARVRRLAEFLEVLGVHVHQKRDGKDAEWRKAVVNAVINPLGTLMELKNGALLNNSPAAALVDALAKELQVLIDVEGMAFDALDIVRETARATAGNRNSMWQDLTRGRRSEIQEVTGRLIAHADARGVSLPTHKYLYYKILSLEFGSLSKSDSDVSGVDMDGRSP